MENKIHVKKCLRRLLRMRSGRCWLFVASVCALITAPVAAPQKAERPTKEFTGRTVMGKGRTKSVATKSF